MDDENLLLMLKALGDKVYDLQLGFTAIFNVFVASDADSLDAFHAERKKLENHPDFRQFREALDALTRNPKEHEALEAFLKKPTGPIQ